MMPPSVMICFTDIAIMISSAEGAMPPTPDRKSGSSFPP